MSDDIRADREAPADLLVVGGLTIDILDGTEVVGGAARHSTEAALAAGLRVALITVAADEPLIRDWLDMVRDRVDARWQVAPTSIRFEHHGHHAARRLRLESTTEPIQVADARLPDARAVLFAPVAGEVEAEALARIRAPIRAAGLQGWLRATGAEGWVERRRLSDVPTADAAALRGLDLLLASVDELRDDDGADAIARLRAWAGTDPELVVTGGAAGAWAQAGDGIVHHVPARVVRDRHTVGAGDSFAAVLVARRGSGLELHAAATASAEATADYLERRPQPVPPRMPAMATESADLASFEGVVWRATRFGPALATIPPDESEFSLEVQGDRLAGRSGCNRYMGTWSVVDDRIQIGPMASTMMYCDGLMELERTFQEAIQSVTAASEDGDHLVLRASGDPVAEFARTESTA